MSASSSATDPWSDDAYTDPPDPPTLADLSPSGALAFELDHATRYPDQLCAVELVDAVVGYERVIAWATARQHQLIAAFHARPGDGTVRPVASSPDPAAEPPGRRAWAADEIGLALTVASGAAYTLVARADRLDAVLRPTRDLLEAGGICPGRARLVADMLAAYDDEVAAAVQARVLPRASGMTWGQLRVALTRAILAEVPDPAARHRRARRERRVELYPGTEGMATLSAYLTAAEATASFEWVTRLALGVRPTDGEVAGSSRGRRSMDRRRADVLVALLTGRLVAATDTTDPADPTADPTDTATGRTGDPADTDTTGDPGDLGDLAAIIAAIIDSAADPAVVTPAAAAAGAAGGAAGVVVAAPVSAHRPLIHVTVPITTLLGLDEEPAELAGYGPIPAVVAREIAADPGSTWRRLLTDPVSGTLLDLGRRTYRPPAGLGAFVRARDGHCRYPGCRRPAVACELDHVVAWQDSGSTSEANLCSLCERHHDLKHDGSLTGWRVVLHADRSCTWTTPTGHRYRSHPVDHRSAQPPDRARPEPPPRPTGSPFDTTGPPAPDDDPPPF